MSYPHYKLKCHQKHLLYESDTVLLTAMDTYTQILNFWGIYVFSVVMWKEQIAL